MFDFMLLFSGSSFFFESAYELGEGGVHTNW